MNKAVHIGIDLGAGSGRLYSGFIDADRLEIKEIYRFPNRVEFINGHLRWNVQKLFSEIITGLKVFVENEKVIPSSVGVDSWGVDFGMLDEKGELIELPVCYRDKRTDSLMATFFEQVPPERIYDLTGIQLIKINTLFQIYSLYLTQPEKLKKVKDIVFIPDLFNYFLTGNKCTEFSFATTTQLFNPHKGKWENELLKNIGLSKDNFQPVTTHGRVIGEMKINTLPEIPVLSVVSHDTGSAVAAVPSVDDNWAFISSGTWSLMGVELDSPLINDLSYKLNFTNEGGVNGTYRFLKNITGLWILQQCVKEWNKNANYTYSELIIMAKKEKAFTAFLDTGDNIFQNPDNILVALQTYFSGTNQKVENNAGAIVRILIESLALKYRYVLEELQRFTEFDIKNIYMIGGGSKNDLLCRFTANACGLPVIKGPAESTSIGNILVQSMGLNEISSLSELRNIVRVSSQLKTYEPENITLWNEAFDKYKYVTSL